MLIRAILTANIIIYTLHAGNEYLPQYEEHMAIAQDTTKPYVKRIDAASEACKTAFNHFPNKANSQEYEKAARLLTDLMSND